MAKFLVLSILIHSMVYLALVSSNFEKSKNLAPTNSLEFEVINSKIKQLEIGRQDEVSKNASDIKSNINKDQLNLIPKLDFNAAANSSIAMVPATTDDSMYSKEINNLSVSAMESSLAMGLGESLAMDQLADKLWKRINNSLSFPEQFIELEVYGRVELFVEIDEDLNLVGNILTRSDNLALEVYSLALVHNSLKVVEPLGDVFQVSMVFDFLEGDRGAGDVSDLQMREKIARNYLKFERYSGRVALDNWVRDITTHYLPISPVGLDFIALYKVIKNFNKPNPRAYRKFQARSLNRFTKFKTKEFKSHSVKRFKAGERNSKGVKAVRNDKFDSSL
ncbi:MAG: hypothetical protein AB8E15_12955 [Bdellovibrionales bacterium]